MSDATVERTLSPLFTWRGEVSSEKGPDSPTTRHVLLVLSLHMSEKGDSCFPSTRLLAEETGLTRRSVEKHLRKAVEDGWLERSEVERRRDGTYKPLEYRAAVPGERGSPGPGEPDSPGPGESDDSGQGNEVPHRSSTREGDNSSSTSSSLPSVETSDEPPADGRLAETPTPDRTGGTAEEERARPPEEPDTPQGVFCEAVRTYGWAGGDPPPSPDDQPWTMGREVSVGKRLLERNVVESWTDLAELVRWTAVMRDEGRLSGLVAQGQPFSCRVYRSRKIRGVKIPKVVEHFRDKRTGHRASEELGTVGGVLQRAQEVAG